MKLDITVAGLVLMSALMHAVWNAIVKSDKDRLATFGLVMITGTVMCILATPLVELPPPAIWGYLAVSVVVHNFYYFFLLRAYAHGDLSHVYPIARGLGPLLVAILSGTLIGEHLSFVEASGVALVSLGILSLAFAKGWPRGGEWRPVFYAVCTGITIASYTLLDGLGARASPSALSYIVWLNILEGPWVFAIAVWQRGSMMFNIFRGTAWRGIGGGIVATIGYGIGIWALSVGAMAHVAALRETSSLFGALIGAIVLHEAFGARRILAASLIVAGLLMMHLPFLR